MIILLSLWAWWLILAIVSGNAFFWGGFWGVTPILCLALINIKEAR